MQMQINAGQNEEMEGRVVRVFFAAKETRRPNPCARAAAEQDEFGGICTFHAHLLMKPILTCLYQHKATERD